MFRAAEVGRKISKAEFKALVPPLRIELVDTQQSIRKAKRFPVIIVFGGVDGAGKSETINLLNEWMDPRWINTCAYGPPSDEERERPPSWRYWRDLPGRGRIGLFLASWYSQPILNRVSGELDDGDFLVRLERIARFEKALADDGALILKFWMHLSREAQKKRLKSLERDKTQAWRVTKRDWENWKNYDRFIAAAEDTLTRTSTADAPWYIVEGADERYRSIQVCTILRDAVRRHLERPSSDVKMVADTAGRAKPAGAAVAGKPAGARAAAKRTPPPAEVTVGDQPSVLDALDMTQSVSKSDYDARLPVSLGRLNGLYRRAKEAGRSTVLVFEGWDAAGKGGAIRRLVQALDARDYSVVPVAAPNDEERAHHYLWRFWRGMSRAGRFTIWDRSWYGRVLVERVEGFASPDEWRRAYSEINDFEYNLIDHGIVLIKYWMHITKEEQLNRFEARAATPFKSWKLTEEDWRNRDKWDDYERAVFDMIAHTSTRHAPWVLTEANCKRFARLKVIDTVADRLEAALERGRGRALRVSPTAA